MKSRLFVFSLLVLLSLPFEGVAQTHSDHSQGGKVASSGNAPTGGHTMHGNAIMLEEVTESGVKAMVHLMDVSAMMGKMGRKENYHFMIMFTDTATGKGISQGSVALKITGPGQAKAGEPIALMAMDGMFGADVDLTAKGLHKLEVGSKLADGTKRQFTFHYAMK